MDPIVLNLIISVASIVITRFLLPFLPPGIPWFGIVKKVINQVNELQQEKSEASRERDELIHLFSDAPIKNENIVDRAVEMGLNYAAKAVSRDLLGNK